VVSVRVERKSEHDAVWGIHVLAFGQENEGNLVTALRKAEGHDPELSLVAIIDHQVVGHILFSPLAVRLFGDSAVGGDVAGDAPDFVDRVDVWDVGVEGGIPALALAPLAVRPDFQNQGIGSALVREGLEAARLLGHRIVIVVGDPAYYGRFGFSPARPLGLVPSLDVPGDAFMAIELVPGALAGVKGEVVYPAVFHTV
jgi:putative acetyltransferase